MSAIDEEVRNVATTRLSECLAAHRPKPHEAVQVDVTIRIARLSAAARQEIEWSLEQVCRAYPSVRHHLDVVSDRVRDAEFDVVCEVRRETGTGESTGSYAPEYDDEPPQLLTLGHGAMRFDYLLDPSDDRRPNWVSLLRPGPRDNPVRAIVLPEALTAVPHGQLVEICFVEGRFAVRRTPTRPEYTVLVNDTELHPGPGGRSFVTRGTIEYRAAGRQPCQLAYQLTDCPAGRDQALPRSVRPATRTDERYLTRLVIDQLTGPLTVEPPAPGTWPRDRWFPTTSPDSGHSRLVRATHAQVLYTRATGGPAAGPQDWHVKIYRCATPQHSAQLRRYLSTQAQFIAQVNTRVGGTGLRPSWAIAPVHVLPEPATDPAAPQPTDMRMTTEDVLRDPGSLLPSWFGATDQPQPGCFVLVASPMLRHVEWADSRRRATAPGVQQLRELVPLAKGIDRCHELGIAHCDIKAQNVCRYTGASGDAGYVLIDGDAVARTVGRIAEQRFTPAWASPAVRAQAARVRAPGRAGDRIDNREHDRFGFVLVVLTAVIGIDRVSTLLDTNDTTGQRGVDAPEVVRDALFSSWEPKWSTLLAELARPFEAGALAGDDWTAGGWLGRLIELADAVVAEQAKPPPEPVITGRYGRHIAGIRDEVRSRPRGRMQWRPEVIKSVRRQQVAVARSAYRRTVLGWGVAPMAVLLLVVVALVVHP